MCLNTGKSPHLYGFCCSHCPIGVTPCKAVENITAHRASTLLTLALVFTAKERWPSLLFHADSNAWVRDENWREKQEVPVCLLQGYHLFVIQQDCGSGWKAKNSFSPRFIFCCLSDSFCSLRPELHLELFTQSEPVVLKLGCPWESPGGLVKTQIPGPYSVMDSGG